MLKKFLMPIVILGMLCFVQCSDDHATPDQGVFKAGKGGGNGGGGNGGGGNGGGGEEETAGNNLSFPVFALDGVTITPIPPSQEGNPWFNVIYTGPYTGLTEDEIDWLEANGPWYAQKVEDNKWQADFENANENVNVTFVDWGDVLEVVNPKMGRPTRLEVTLYVGLGENYDHPEMTGYTMAVLANPSSPNEVQGTNTLPYNSIWATVTSTNPNLIVQHLESGAEPVWNESIHMWEGNGVEMPSGSFGFGPELNVGGKYIFGASSGGWRPQELGVYRLTFYMTSSSSFIHLEDAIIGNYPGNESNVPLAAENTAAEAVVDTYNNLTYIDVTVITGGGGGGGGKH